VATIVALEVWYRTLLPASLPVAVATPLPPLVRAAFWLEINQEGPRRLPKLFPFLVSYFFQERASAMLPSAVARVSAHPVQGEGNMKGQLRALALTTWFGRHWTADECLETYASLVWLGDEQVGLSSGSAHYFGLPLERLSPSQVALLIGMVQAPTALHPACHPARAESRRNLFLQRMRDARLLDAGEFSAAAKEPLGVVVACGA
jgi:hypothetical protein